MAPNVDFDIENPWAVTSFCPFDKEWKKLDELHGLQEVGRSKIVALKSSNIEYFIPKAFAALFLAILVLLVMLVATNWPPSSLARQPINSAISEPYRRTQ